MALNSLGVGFLISAKDAASKAFATVGKALGNLAEKNKELRKNAAELSSEMKRVGVAMMAVGAAGLAGLGVAADKAADFTKGIAEISTLIDSTDETSDKMRNIVMGALAAYGGNVTDQIKAVYQGISAGASDAAASQALLTQSNKLAIAGVTGVSTALDGLTNSLNAYGMAYTEKNLVATSDAFFVAVKMGKTKVEDLANQIGRVAPVAANAGISLDELLASLAAITTKGINTESAVAGLNGALANIIHPSSHAAAEAARLGIKFTTAALRAKGWVGFLDQITHSAKYNADSLGKLFESVEGLRVMQALTANGSKALGDTLGEMAKKAGGTETAFEYMSEQTAFQKQLFAGLSSQATIMIGEALLPLMGVVLRVANAFLRGFNAIPKPIKTVLVSLFGVLSGALLVIGGIVTMTGVIVGLIAIGDALLIAFAATIGIFAAVAAVMAVLALAGAGLYAAWQRDLGGMREFVESAIAKIQLAWEALSQLFSTGQFSGSLMKELSKAGNEGVMAFAITVYLWFNRIKNFFAGLSDAFTGVVATMGPTFDRITDGLNRIGTSLGLVQDAPDAARSKWEQFGQAGARVGKVLGSAFDFMVKVVAAAIDYFDGLIVAIQTFGPSTDELSGTIANVVSVFQELVEAIVGTDAAASGSGSGWRMFGAVVGAIIGTLLRMITTFINVAAIVGGVVTGALGAVRAIIVGLIDSVSGFVNVISDLLTGQWGKAWDDAKLAAFNSFKAIVGILGSLAGIVAGTIDKIGRMIGKDFGLSAGLKDFQSGILKKTAGAMGVPVPGEAPVIRQGTTTVDRPKGVPRMLARPEDAWTVPMAIPQEALTPGSREAQHAASAANRPPPPPTIHNHNHIVVQLDSTVIAEHMQNGDARGFGPAPART